MDCIFCKIVEGEIPCNLVYQDELIMCFLDIYPFNDIGHYHMHVFPRYKGDGFGWTIPDTNHKVSQGIANELREMLNF